VRTPIEIPDALFRTAKASAADRGQSLKQFVAEALQERLAGRRGQVPADEPAWMHGFGRLRRLRSETRPIQARVDEAFETIEPGDCASC
jgi:hypothetical protein